MDSQISASTPSSNSSQALRTVRGMHDFLPAQTRLVAQVENIARQLFQTWGYQEIRTPVMEFAFLFERAIGAATDIVEKEMFTLTDRGDRLLCLRPEGTAGVVRSYIEHHLDQLSPIHKLFYMGPMFRAERPQAGRYREFWQMGCEYLGNASSGADAEMIVILESLLKKLNISQAQIKLNNMGCSECRPAFQQKLIEYLESKKDQLCKDCQRRMNQNPLRALDCKVDQGYFQEAPESIHFLCAACKNHHEQVIAYLKQAQVAFVIDPRLVRGLDYYTRTVFEVYAIGKTGSQDALAAGGRYDSLVRNLGGPETPAIGFAIGLERILNFIVENSTMLEAILPPSIFIATLGSAAHPKAFEIYKNLVDAGFKTYALFDDRSLKSQMRLANAWNARFCFILGENELAENKVTLKDLQMRTQELIDQSQVIQRVQEILKS